MDRPRRERNPPKPLYVPDLDFLNSRYFNKEDLEEDERMTQMYNNEDYISHSDLSDSEEEEQIEYFKAEGKDIDAYYNTNGKKRKRTVQEDSYSPSGSETEDYLSPTSTDEESEEDSFVPESEEETETSSSEDDEF